MRGLATALLLAGCSGTTGEHLVRFNLEAQGPGDAVAGQPYRFITPRGAEVTLTRARLFVGAVYFNQTNPAGWAQESSCTLPGVYTGEVRGSLTIDALDPTPQPFSVPGNGTSMPTQAAELWLTAQDITADDEKTVVLEVAGEAVTGMQRWPFEAGITIGVNRRVPPRNPALPGSNTLCQQRIVTPIAFETVFTEGGTVRLTVDPKAWFSSVDFASLKPSPADPSRYRFVDAVEGAGQPDAALFNALRAAQGPYHLEWRPK